MTLEYKTLKRNEIHGDLRLVVANFCDDPDGTPSEDYSGLGVYISQVDYDKVVNFEKGWTLWVSDDELPYLIKALQEFLPCES